MKPKNLSKSSWIFQTNKKAPLCAEGRQFEFVIAVQRTRRAGGVKASGPAGLKKLRLTEANFSP